MYLNELVVASLDLGLNRFDIAEIVGTTPNVVRDWIQGKAEPGPHFEQTIEELGEVSDAIAEKMSPRAARQWLSNPAPELDFYAPIDVLRRGELYTILSVVEAMPMAFQVSARSLLDDIEFEGETPQRPSAH